MTIVAASAAKTSVFCAVWSGDPERHELLRGHQRTLDRQSVGVAALYVFDDGDEPPPWLRGQAVVADSPLTIYQAWNVATQIATTTNVMNLNLDDRLVAQGVEALEVAIDANSVGLVGGDWRVCYSQQATDETPEEPALATAIPFAPAWPPEAGTVTRLGSGTGHRGTLGPATLWRRALHDTTPYPHQFANGQPIRSIGDAAWWLAAQQVAGAATLRLPLVIGHYHSHPEGQAEFRFEDEMELLRGGITPGNHSLEGIRTVRDQGQDST